MKDRVPTYPGRVKLMPVEGQENTYDMTRADQPTQAGTPLNKATLLKDETAEKLGLDPADDPTVDDAFSKSIENLDVLEEKVNDTVAELASVKGGLTKKEIQRFTSSGRFTVPDGVTEIDVYLVGGGGGGGEEGSYGPSGAGGGGYCKLDTFAVTPGTSYTVTIGAGGAEGRNGGSSSFGNLLTAAGGQSPYRSTYGGNGGSGGGAAETSTDGHCGGAGGVAGGKGEDGSAAGGAGGGNTEYTPVNPYDGIAYGCGGGGGSRSGAGGLGGGCCGGIGGGGNGPGRESTATSGGIGGGGGGSGMAGGAGICIIYA